MYGYGMQNAWDTQMQQLINQMNTLQGMKQASTQQPQPSVQPVQSIQIPTVHGLEAAKNVTLPPSSSAIIMDADDLIFNVIITDSNGVKTLKRYKGVEIEEESTPLPVDYVTKNEFKSLSDKVNSLYDKLNSQNNKDKR